MQCQFPTRRLIALNTLTEPNKSKVSFEFPLHKQLVTVGRKYKLPLYREFKK